MQGGQGNQRRKNKIYRLILASLILSDGILDKFRDFHSVAIKTFCSSIQWQRTRKRFYKIKNQTKKKEKKRKRQIWEEPHEQNYAN